MICGIYCILNTDNNKRYIGRSVDIKDRWAHHKSVLRKGKHLNKYLQRAWAKYGEDAFSFFILEEVLCESELPRREGFWAVKYDAFNKKRGYNIDKIDLEGKVRRPNHSKRMSGEKHPLYGVGHSEETKKKMSEDRQGEKHHWFGKKHTQRTKEILRDRSSGERKNCTKLTWEAVREIRAKYIKNRITQKELSIEYNVSRRAIGMVVSNKTWREET